MRAETAGGSIRLQGARGRVVAETAGGSIDLLEVEGAVRASTAAGRILAEFNCTKKSFGPSQLETSMGDVYVYLPANVPLTIDAAIDTAAGRQIQSDFPLDIQGDKEELVPSTLRGHGTLNGGGEILKIRTVAGNIEIRKIDEASLRELQQREESNWKAWQQRRAEKDRRARKRKRNGGSANRKGMRTIMTSNQANRSRNSKIEIRNSARPSRISSFDFRVSNFAFALKLTLLLTLALGLGGWLRPAFGTERVWEKRFELPPGGHVSVVNVQGSVLVEGWDRAEVEATVAMRSEAPTDQLDDVQVAVEARRGGVAFHTLYPSGLDTPIRVDYRLRVPRQVRLDELSTLEGDIVVHDVEGAMEAHNLHGDIEGINVAGSVGGACADRKHSHFPARPARSAPAVHAGHHQWQCGSAACRRRRTPTWNFPPWPGTSWAIIPFKSVPRPVIPLVARRWAKGACGWNCARCAEIFAWSAATMISENCSRNILPARMKGW